MAVGLTFDPVYLERGATITSHEEKKVFYFCLINELIKGFLPTEIIQNHL